MRAAVVALALVASCSGGPRRDAPTPEPCHRVSEADERRYRRFAADHGLVFIGCGEICGKRVNLCDFARLDTREPVRLVCNGSAHGTPCQ